MQLRTYSVATFTLKRAYATYIFLFSAAMWPVLKLVFYSLINTSKGTLWPFSFFPLETEGILFCFYM